LNEELHKPLIWPNWNQFMCKSEVGLPPSFGHCW